MRTCVYVICSMLYNRAISMIRYNTSVSTIEGNFLLNKPVAGSQFLGGGTTEKFSKERSLSQKIWEKYVLLDNEEYCICALSLYNLKVNTEVSTF